MFDKRQPVMLCDEHAVQRLADRCKDSSHTAFLGGGGRCQMFYGTGVCRLLTRLNEAARSTHCAAGTTLLLLPPTPDPFDTQSHKHSCQHRINFLLGGGDSTPVRVDRGTHYCPHATVHKLLSVLCRLKYKQNLFPYHIPLHSPPT